MNKLKFYFFHLMPSGFVPRSSEFDSSWVTLSNEHYDPTRGHQLYNEYINLLVAAEKYGYDGAIVNELPDRFSDVLIFTGVALSGLCQPAMAYAAAVGALLVAYVGILAPAVSQLMRLLPPL